MSRTLLRFARRRAAALFTACVGLLLTSATVASAETLMMPNRPTLTGINTVVWGVTTQANGTPYTINYGDASPNGSGNVVDQSYIAFDHTYALANTYTATLTVGAESATVVIQAFDPGALTAEQLRGVNINRAIEDGLRYLWVNQSSRAANFPNSPTTTWPAIASFDLPAASLATLAFENHGYKLPNDNSTPTGLYEKYAVRRGLNQILNTLKTLNLDMQPAGNPCVGSGAGPSPGPGFLCVGLMGNQQSNSAGQSQFTHSGYETPFAASVLSASGAPNRTVNEVPGTNSAGYVVGKTYAEILQRVTNAIAWGQQETSFGSGRGGWYYALNYQATSDGSTVGWVMLGLLDAEAAGATLPAFVRPEWTANALVDAINNNGSFDYQSDANPASNSAVNVAKAGVGVQGMFFGGFPVADVRVQNALTYISDRWNNQVLGQQFACSGPTYNKGCAYGMFNVFKGLKLYGIQTLPGVGRPAGPGAEPLNDWYADYVDWLLANQSSPTTQGGGGWNGLGPSRLIFSSQTNNTSAEAAIAELILSPVVLIQPDPQKFSTVGLKQGNPLSIDPMSNPVGTQHTVVAKAESSGGQGIPGVTISFKVTGRNATTGSGQTVADGTVSFSYTDAGNLSVSSDDNIQAFIGQVGSNIQSNVLIKHWIVAAGAARCDANGDGKVTEADLLIIRAANGQTASGPNDPRDGNGDGVINVADVRYCQLRLTK